MSTRSNETQRLGWRGACLALGLGATDAGAQPNRPPAAQPTPQVVAGDGREWFMSPSDAPTLDIWSVKGGEIPRGARRVIVGLVTAGCQGPGGASWQSGTYRVALEELKEPPRLGMSNGAPALTLSRTEPLTRPDARIILSYARPPGAGVSCIVRVSKPYSIDARDAPAELTQFRYGR